LGIGGGGGGGGGLMSGRSATTSIARMTGILGALFIVNSLALSVVFNIENQDSSIIDDANAEAPLTSTTDSNDTTTPLDEAIETPETSGETTVSDATDTPDDE